MYMQDVTSRMTSENMYFSYDCGKHRLQDATLSVLTSQKLWQPQVPFSSPPSDHLLDPLEG